MGGDLICLEALIEALDKWKIISGIIPCFSDSLCDFFSLLVTMLEV